MTDIVSFIMWIIIYASMCDWKLPVWRDVQ